MKTLHEHWPTITISALALAVAGCGGSSGGGSSSGILGSAKAAADLGDHEEVLARVILARELAPALQGQAGNVSYLAQEVTYQYGPLDKPPASKTTDCANEDGGSGSLSVALDTVTTAPDLVPADALPDGPFAFSGSTVTANNCVDVYITEENALTETDSADGQLRLVIPGSLVLEGEFPGLQPPPEGSDWRFVSAENYREVSIREYDSGDRYEDQALINGAVAIGYQLVSEYNDLAGAFELTGSRDRLIPGLYRDETEFAVALLDVGSNQPSLVSSYDGMLIYGHFRLGIDGHRDYQDGESSDSEGCEIPGAFTVEITTPIAYDFDDEPNGGELTLSSGNRSADVVFSPGEVTITIDGVPMTYGDEDSEVFENADDKAGSCLNQLGALGETG